MKERQTERCMTLYRGQQTEHNDKPFAPDLLRVNDDGTVIDKIEEFIKTNTNTTDLDPYKSALCGCTISIPSCPSLQTKFADKNHLYYFFLSLVNIGIRISQNPMFNDYLQSFFKQFVGYDPKHNVATLSCPSDVLRSIEQCLHKESIFDGRCLNLYSLFQHFNFIFPNTFPTMLLDWTSDIEIAEYFSKDSSGKLGTIVSIEFPNRLFHCFCHYSGTADVLSHQSIFFDAYGYACDHYDCGHESRVIKMNDGRDCNFSVPKPYLRFEKSLITLQQATCLYWPYAHRLDQLPQELKDTIGFKVLSEYEIERKKRDRKYKET
jgi:hypothetical protein